MTRYMEPSFSVLCGGDQQYRDNWDAIFAPKPEETTYASYARIGIERPFLDLDVEDWYDDICTRMIDDPVPSEIRYQVEEFHVAMGQHVGLYPKVPAPSRVKLRLNLIAEEFLELLDACTDGFNLAAVRTELDIAINEGDYEVDMVEVADALADIDYVVEGMRLEFGINGFPIADEVHRSNMTKLNDDGFPEFREDGKLLKGPNYSPPDIAGELGKQGWEV